MTEESFKRKLTAILSADVEGYSRLMGEDEDATIRTLTAYRGLMSTIIQKHRGRVVDSPGDNLLAEFLSVVDAVRCAVEIQEELRVRNVELPENRRMEFRIGLNLGDVVEEGERIYGDGINIAARVEGLAEGGGICISGTVYDSIKNKLSLSYESLGEHTVKNITEPVRVYRMRVGPKAAVRQRPRYWHKAALASLIVLIVAAGAWAIWNFYFRPPPMEVASAEKIALPLPDKPSIAVLPFEVLSGDPEKDYFASALTDEVITRLSMFRDIFVIARNSVLTYKGKSTTAQQIGQELGVSYIMTGTVQKGEDKITITVKVVDAASGHHVWAHRYERDLKDIFAVQNEIAASIVGVLGGPQGQISNVLKRTALKRTDNLTAYDLVLRSDELNITWTKEDNAKARQLLEEALRLDPNYAFAYTTLAWNYGLAYLLKFGPSPEEDLQKGFELAKKAVSLDEADAESHWVLGYIYLMKGEHERSLETYERARALNPNYADLLAEMGYALTYSGRAKQGLAQVKRAMRLNPFYPDWYLWVIGVAQYTMHQYEDAVAALKKITYHSTETRLYLAASYAQLGRLEEARTELKEVLKLDPGVTLESWGHSQHFKNEVDLEHFCDGLRKAGLK